MALISAPSRRGDGATASLTLAGQGPGTQRVDCVIDTLARGLDRDRAADRPDRVARNTGAAVSSSHGGPTDVVTYP